MLIETKKSRIKMLKMALLDCAINEKCCSVDRGWGICPLFLSPSWGCIIILNLLGLPKKKNELTTTENAITYHNT